MISYVRRVPGAWQHYVQEGAWNTAQRHHQGVEEVMLHYTPSQGRRGVTEEAKEGHGRECFRRSQGHGIYFIKAKIC